MVVNIRTLSSKAFTNKWLNTEDIARKHLIV